MGVSTASTGKPARALGAMLLVTGLAGGLLAGAAGSAAAQQAAAMPAAGRGHPAARRKAGRRTPVGPLHLVVQLLGGRDGAQPQ